MATWPYTKGLHDFGNGCFAWLAPDGSWGLSNAGLIVDGGESLLVDTLFTLGLTREMLDEMKRRVPGAAHIDTLVNTHANGDHTFGNQLVSGARIVATKACADEYRDRPPAELQARMANWRNLGDGGKFMHEAMGSRFDFSGVVYTPPTDLFQGERKLTVGSKELHLVEAGPAHTRGDLLIYVPQDRTVFTGDLLFVKGHPVVWAGPFSNWIKACDLILSWDVETIVPGHGPMTDKQGVAALKHYLEYVYAESRKRYDAGLSYHDAAREIELSAFSDWLDSERIFINVHAAYREFAGDKNPPDVPEIFGHMWRYREAAKAGGCPVCNGGAGRHNH